MATIATTPEIDFEKVTAGAAVDVLTRILSDEHVLYIKLRNYHWNVTGAHFVELHGLFAKQYGILESHIDEVAERIGALGAHAIGTMAEYLQRTALQEHARPGGTNDMLLDLLGDHVSIIRFIGESLAPPAGNDLDPGSSDLLIGLMQDHEKMAWMLRAILSGGPGNRLASRPVPYSVLYD